METKFTPHPYTLNVNCYQASILCQFEAHESLTVEELQRLTLMDRSVLVKQLKHLCNPKKNLLCSKYKSHPLFLDPDIITLNLKFSHPLLKINYIPKIGPKIKENRQEIHEEVKPLKAELEMADIKQTKALIVHMMKKRKVMHQKDIVYKMMRKRAKLRRSEKMILGCIEQLAEAEYMAYMDESKENYKYMP